MSDHDTNEQRPADPVEPTSSGGTDAGSGWRPAATPPPSPTNQPAAEGDTTPMAPSDPAHGSASGSSGHFDGTQPLPIDGQPSGGWPVGGTPGAYQTGSHPVGAYPSTTYPQSTYQPYGYQPGGEPSTGAGYVGATTGAGWAGAYQQGVPDGPRRGRAGVKAAAAILGVLLAIGGGVAGAAWMHHLDGNNVTTTSAVGEGGAPDNAPIIDRSSLASIAAAVRPSVVSIGTANATGSGVILSSDGYILTNNHV